RDRPRRPARDTSSPRPQREGNAAPHDRGYRRTDTTAAALPTPPHTARSARNVTDPARGTRPAAASYRTSDSTPGPNPSRPATSEEPLPVTRTMGKECSAAPWSSGRHRVRTARPARGWPRDGRRQPRRPSRRGRADRGAGPRSEQGRLRRVAALEGPRRL